MAYPNNTEMNLDEVLMKLKEEKNGEKALMILRVVSYCASEGIHTSMFSTSVSDPAELKDVLQLLEQRSLITAATEDEWFVMTKGIQNHVRNCLKEEETEEEVLRSAVTVLSDNLIYLLDYYHLMSLWSFAKEYRKLVDEFYNLPSLIIRGLKNHSRYGDAYSFGNECLDFFKKAIPEQHPAVTTLQYDFGILLGAEGHHKEAVELLLTLYNKQNLMFASREEITQTLIAVARQLSLAGRHTESLQYYEKICDGPLAETDDKALLDCWHGFAVLLCNMGSTTKAENILQELLKKKIEILDPNDDEICSIKMSIGRLLMKQGRFRAALEFYQDAYNKRKENLGETHAQTLTTRSDIAACLHDLGECDKAITIFEDVAEKFDSLLGHLHRDTLITRVSLAYIYFRKSEYEKAYKMFRDLYEKMQMTLGEKEIDTLRVKFNIGKTLLKLNRKEDALTVLEEALETYTEVLGHQHVETTEVRSMVLAIKSNSTNSFSKSTEKIHETKLHFLARKGRFDELASLIQDCANINIKDPFGNTPLHKAAECGHIEIVRLLLKHGVIYNPRNSKNQTPLGLSRNQVLKNLFVLVERFFTDVKNGNLQQVLQNLAVEGVVINARDYNGRTALHWAVSEDRKDILKMLLERGADILTVTNKHNNVLHIAVSGNRREIIQLLFKSAKKDKLNKIINAKTLVKGNTPLHVAAEKGYFELVKELLEHGAQFDIQNSDDKTAVKLATIWNIENLLNLIDAVFEDAQKGNGDILDKLQVIDPVYIGSIMKSRNNQGHTLLQTSILNNHPNMSKNLLKLLKGNDKNKSD